MQRLERDLRGPASKAALLARVSHNPVGVSPCCLSGYHLCRLPSNTELNERTAAPVFYLFSPLMRRALAGTYTREAAEKALRCRRAAHSGSGAACPPRGANAVNATVVSARPAHSSTAIAHTRAMVLVLLPSISSL
jgi:hypothetical protein